MAEGVASIREGLLKELDGDYKFSEKDLAWIARKIVDIDHLYLLLDITQAERKGVQKNNPHDYSIQKTDLMLLWRKKKGKQATLKTLVTSLVDDDLADASSIALAEEIIEHFKSKCTDDAVGYPVQVMDDVDQLQANRNIANRRLESQAECQYQIEDQPQIEELVQAGDQDEDEAPPPSTMDKIYQLNAEMCKYVNMMSLIPYLNKHGILTSEERYHLNSPHKSPSEKVNYLLEYLEGKGEATVQKFLIALKEAKEHTGHIELCKLLNEKDVKI